MEIKLLSNKKGIILTRAPEVVNDMLRISFHGAPEGSTAIFVNNKKESLYRPIVDGATTVPKFFLKEKISLTVTQMSGRSNDPSWKCEDLETFPGINNAVVVYPSARETDKLASELLVECDDLRSKINELEEKIKSQDAQIEALQGHDIE